MATSDILPSLTQSTEYSGEQREKVRSGFNSQLYLYIVNKAWFFSCDHILKQPIYVASFSTSPNRVAPVQCGLPKSRLWNFAASREPPGGQPPPPGMKIVNSVSLFGRELTVILPPCFLIIE
jgi:hypothetical protein